MGNSILAGTLSFNSIPQPLALVQQKPSSPPAQSSPAPVAFGVVGSSPAVAFLALARIRRAEHKEIAGQDGKRDVNIDT